MSPLPWPESLTPRHFEAMQCVRDVLFQVGYEEKKLCALLGTKELTTFAERHRKMPLYLQRTRGDTALETLVRLFWLRGSVPSDAVARAVGTELMKDWEQIGLLIQDGDGLRAAVEIQPFGELFIAADWPGKTSQPWQVMGVAPTTRTLADFLIRRPGANALDLGTGSGALALRASRFHEQVSAVDCNSRAVTLAQLNAAMNDVRDIRWKVGDLFEPVTGESFDLIFCNPPFVVAPETALESTHSCQLADQLCQRIVGQAPEFLRPGGYCQVLCNWAQRKGEDWGERLRGWCHEQDCDAWVLHSHSEDAADYAFGRLGEMHDGPETVGRSLDEWMAYYERENIEAVGFGLITLRRGSGEKNWFRCTPILRMPPRAGDEIEREFALVDFLQTVEDDQSLLHARLTISEDVQIQKSLSPAEATREVYLWRDHGFGEKVGLDPKLLEFVKRLHTKRTLRDHLQEFIGTRELPQGRRLQQFLKVIRRLIELGICIPADNFSTQIA